MMVIHQKRHRDEFCRNLAGTSVAIPSASQVALVFCVFTFAFSFPLIFRQGISASSEFPHKLRVYDSDLAQTLLAHGTHFLGEYVNRLDSDYVENHKNRRPVMVAKAGRCP
jgi:hypothetical protein